MKNKNRTMKEDINLLFRTLNTGLEDLPSARGENAKNSTGCHKITNGKGGNRKKPDIKNNAVQLKK